MRVIFLDIDGVLSDRSTGCTTFNDMAAARIRKLAVERQAVIVITSAWRGGDNLYHELKRTGLMRYSIGETERLPEHPIRGEEIGEWLMRHQPFVESYVIIDDDADMGRYKPRLVQVIRKDGLIWPPDIEAAERMLDRPLT